MRQLVGVDDSVCFGDLSNNCFFLIVTVEADGGLRLETTVYQKFVWEGSNALLQNPRSSAGNYGRVSFADDQLVVPLT